MPGLGDAIDEAVAISKGEDPRVKKLEELAAELWDSGIDYRIVNGKLYVGRKERENTYEAVLGTSTSMRLGVVADTHLGSRFEQLTALNDFYRQAEDEGVDAFIHLGDMVQGTPKMHRGMEHEMHLLSAEGQIMYTVDVYPRTDKKTYVISGNHDDSWINESGINVVRRIAQSRDDIEYVGQDSCFLTLDGLRIYMIHPDGGVSYAKSYRPQKISEAVPIHERTQLLLIGHYHTYGVWKLQDSVVAMQPCFQGQYPWMVRKGLYPTIGGHILEITYDEERIRRFTHTLIDYREQEDDWDRERSFMYAKPGAVLEEGWGA